MELRIKNLFGYRNYDLKLNNKVNILIGENGSGKSTIIKMLTYLFDDNFVELSKIPFEEIYVNLVLDNDTNLFQVINNEKKKVENIELQLKHSDIKQLEFTKDIKFRYILKQYLEEYSFEDDYIEEKFNFEKFLKGLEKKINDEKAGVNIEVDDNYIEKDMKYFHNKLIDLKNLNMNEFYHHNPLETPFIMPFILKNIVYGSRMYLYYLYRYYLLQYVGSKFESCSAIKGVLFAAMYKEYQNIFDLIVFYEESVSFPFKIQEEKEITNGYYIFNEDSTDMFLVESKVSNEEFNQKIRSLYTPFNKGLILKECVIGKADFSDFVIFKDKKEYDIDLISEKSYKKLIKDICNINLLDGCEEEYQKENVIPPLCYESKDEIEPSQFSKYLEVMRIIKKMKGKYKFSKEEKTDERELYEFWSKKKIPSAFSENLEKKFTREDYILELADNPIDMIIVDKLCFDEKNIKFGIFRFYDILDNISKLDIMSYFDSEEAQVFKDLFTRYFSNKKFKFIYNEREKIEISIYDKKSNILINESMLSSGEYKMLRIIKYIALNKRRNIELLDEPELSLSLYWQNMLVDDLIKYTKVNTVIIATQSTNLIKEDQIEYLVEVKYNEE